MKSISSRNQAFLLALLCLDLLCLPRAFADGSDNFDDNSKNTSKWGADIAKGLGVLTEQNHRLEYTCNNPLSDDDTFRPWRLERFPVNGNWTIQVDIFNSTAPTLAFQVNSAGLVLLSPHTADSEINLEFYASSLGGNFTTRKGFDADLETDDVRVGDTDSGPVAGTAAVMSAIRIEYDGTNKVATCLYDSDISDGYQWTFLASYGLAGTNGTTANTDWGLSNSDQLSLYLYGYSGGMTVASGQIYLDNFVETGGVTPSGTPSADPVGSFEFRFPTNNPALTRIVSIAGNYQGITPTVHQRNYNIDVAQDESGKLAIMGTMDGIRDRSSNTVISGVSGTVKTVNGEPTAQVKGSFKGTRDGIGTTFSGKAAAPVELVDVGGGEGLSGTGSYSSRVGGVPFSGRNLPIAIVAPPGAAENLQKDWTLHLDINRKLVGTRERTVASAQLTLPNGDSLSFRERAVKYSVKRGYTLSFTRGTNTTINPSRIDRKSSITIKGMTLSQQGQDWEPTGGVITYKFLGQKGTANLMDFVAP